jgi:hypothetical protein
VHEGSKLVEVEEFIEHADAVRSWLNAARAVDSDTPADCGVFAAGWPLPSSECRAQPSTSEPTTPEARSFGDVDRPTRDPVSSELEGADDRGAPATGLAG